MNTEPPYGLAPPSPVVSFRTVRLCRPLHDRPDRQEVRVGDRSQIVILERDKGFCLSGRRDKLDFKPVRLVDLNDRPNVSTSKTKPLVVSRKHDRVK